MRRLLTSALRAALLSAVLMATSAAGQGSAVDSADPLVLEYHRYSQKLEGQDPTPLLRVFASGRAEIHLPRYVPGAGLYQVQLAANELRMILDDARSGGLVEADSRALAQAVRLAEDQRRRSDGIRHYSSDATVSSLWVTGRTREPLVVLNLHDTARRVADLGPVARFAALELKLLAITERDDRVLIGALD